MEESDIMGITEAMIRQLFQEVLQVELPEFPRMTWQEAMDRFGSDKPDLRIPLELTDVDDLMQKVDFKVFSGPASADDGRVAALKVPGGAKLSRKEIDEYTKFVGIYGAKGLAWIKVNERAKGLEGLQLTETQSILRHTDRQTADDIDKQNQNTGNRVTFYELRGDVDCYESFHEPNA